MTIRWIKEPLGDVEEVFKMRKSHASHIKRQHWDAIDTGGVYPNLQPHKKDRVQPHKKDSVGTKLELTKEIRKNIAKRE